MARGKYRKRPVVVEAVRVAEENDEDLLALERERADVRLFYEAGGARPRIAHAEIKTLEGVMVACYGDWIIIGVAGEAYPCRADIFAATYEPVADRPPGPPDMPRLGRPPEQA